MSVEMDEMTMEQIIKQLRTGRQFGRPCVFARFDAALMLRDRGEWAMLRWFYATDVAASECAYFLRRSIYRGAWDYQGAKPA
jgi:hypothetical protein